jgi:acyl carrier protein
MERQEVMDKVVGIVKPFVKQTTALEGLSADTSILDDLKVNSARLVDIILEFEDTFEIEVGDDDADKVKTIGDATDLVLAKIA